LDSLADDEGFWRRYIPGEKVNVVSPSVHGAAVVLEESRSPESRVKVVLEFMGRMVHAQVPWDNLRPIDNMPEETATKAPRRTRGKNRRIRAHRPPVAATN
jgi:hypothetical protein